VGIRQLFPWQLIVILGGSQPLDIIPEQTVIPKRADVIQGDVIKDVSDVGTGIIRNIDVMERLMSIVRQFQVVVMTLLAILIGLHVIVTIHIVKPPILNAQSNVIQHNAIVF